MVPDVINLVPKHTTDVVFMSNVKVNLGNKLTPTLTQNPPFVKWECEESSFYALCMTDPDAPSRKAPKAREWHHWLVVNIPGLQIDKGDVLSAYIGPGPPKGTGLHRYVFVVYKQDGKITYNEKYLGNNSGDGRANFSIKKFADRYNLGEPISGNFFQAEWDEYVPTLYKKLGM